MKLGDPSFVRRLRRRVRHEVNRDPAMRREARRTRRLSRSLLTRAFLFFLPVLILSALAVQRNPLLALCGVTIWATASVLHRARDLQAFFIGKEGLAPFYIQPVSRKFVYAYGWRDFLRKSVGLFIVGIVVLSILALNSAQGWSGVGRAAVCAILLWSTTVACAIILLRHWPTARFGMAGGVATAVCFVLALGTDKMRNAVQSGIAEGAYPALRILTPGGWICSIAEWGLGISTQFPIAGAVLAVALIGYAITVESGLREEFTFFEGDFPPHSLEDESQSGAIDEGESNRHDLPVSPGAVEENEVAAALRKALEPVAMDRIGWVERLILHGFSPREFVVLNFLLGRVPAWTHGYRRGAVMLAVLLAMFYAISAILGPHPLSGKGVGWIYWGTTAIALLHMTPFFGGLWMGFEAGSIGNRAVSFLSMLPVGVGEARRIMLRINRRRLLLASPWIVAVIFTFTRLHNGLYESVGIGIVSVALLWAVLPLGVLFLFSSTTNDNAGAFWFKWLMIAAFLFLAICGLVTIFFVLTGKFVLCVAGVVAFAAVAQGVYAFYFYRYRKLRFDTMGTLQE